MEEELTNEQADHGSVRRSWGTFLVVGYGKLQVCFSERRSGVVLKINGPNIFTAKCTFLTCLKTKISPTSINFSETKISQPFVKTSHVLA